MRRTCRRRRRSGRREDRAPHRSFRRTPGRTRFSCFDSNFTGHHRHCEFLTCVHVLAAHFARGLHQVRPHREQRARGRPGARRTRGLVCKLHKKMRTRAYRFGGGIPAFPAQWFYGLYRALPGERAFLPPSPCRNSSARLSASIGAPEPHDFAVRFTCTRLSHVPRPPHPTARS